MIHIEKDGKDQTAHIMSLDLRMDDSSMMTFTWRSSQGKKAERTEGVAGSCPEIKKSTPSPPLSARLDGLEGVSHLRTASLKPLRKQLSLACF